MKQLKYKVVDDENQKRSIEKLLKQIRRKLYLLRGPEIGKVDQTRLWEEAVADLGCER